MSLEADIQEAVRVALVKERLQFKLKLSDLQQMLIDRAETLNNEAIADPVKTGVKTAAAIAMLETSISIGKVFKDY